VVGGFGSEEQGRKPEGRMNTASLGGRMVLQPLHDVLGMPIHHRVLEIESFQVGNSGGLYFLWEVKVAT